MIRPPSPACDARPQSASVVTVRDEENRTHWFFTSKATVERARGDMQRFTYDLRDSRGETQRLTYDGPMSLPGVEVGREYTWHVEYLGGWPASSALLVSDAAGLLFAAVSDVSVGERVLKSGVPRFAVRVLPAVCPPRPKDSACFEGIANLPVEITHGEATAVAYHGQTVTLGGYEVRVLVAQTPGTNTGGCTDAAVNNVSYTIQRIGAPFFSVPR